MNFLLLNKQLLALANMFETAIDHKLFWKVSWIWASLKYVLRPQNDTIEHAYWEHSSSIKFARKVYYTGTNLAVSPKWQANIICSFFQNYLAVLEEKICQNIAPNLSIINLSTFKLLASCGRRNMRFCFFLRKMIESFCWLSCSRHSISNNSKRQPKFPSGWACGREKRGGTLTPLSPREKYIAPPPPPFVSLPNRYDMQI